MPTDLVLLVVTGLFAVTALAAAVVAVRAGRRTPSRSSEPAPKMQTDALDRLPRVGVLVPVDDDETVRMAPRHVNGRVVVPPTDQQVMGAVMSRPHIRLAVLAQGLTYALRAESRDRIMALMRREYRRRRRERLAAGRRAVRAARPTSSGDWTAESWIGELPAHASAEVEL